MKALVRILFAVSIAAGVWIACSSSSGSSDAGTETPDSGTNVPDAGDGKCHGDEGCPANEYCDLASGACLPAKPCSSNDDCEYQATDTEDYCAYGGCFCDPTRNNGSCRPRVGLCKPCTRDLECGNDSGIYLNYTATCATDPSGAKVCLPLKTTGCPAGYVAGSTGTCLPGGGACGSAAPCTKDDDCDPRGEKPICDVRRGFCVAPCAFDYQKGSSDSCPPGQACHVDPRLLTANNPNFGGGKCGDPCDAATDPYVCGPGTSCEVDGDPAIGANKSKRCRPPLPKCVRDADCPPDPIGHSKGFCDKGSLTCQPGCRRETDCDAGFKCLQGLCTEKTCIESGGATLECPANPSHPAGQFCCGETGSPSPCPTGVSVGQCYDPPNPPWCGSCQFSADQLQSFGGLPRPQPSRCVPTTIAGAVHNLQWHACDKNERAQCPSTKGCKQMFQFCTDDSECGGQQGSCAEITTGVVADGQQIEVKANGCTCDQNAGTGCPAPSKCGCTCPGGPNGTCKDPSQCKDQNGNPLSGPMYNGVCVANWCDMSDCISKQ